MFQLHPKLQPVQTQLCRFWLRLPSLLPRCDACSQLQLTPHPAGDVKMTLSDGDETTTRICTAALRNVVVVVVISISLRVRVRLFVRSRT